MPNRRAKSDLGQVFTRKIVADYMVSLFTLPKSAHIIDPCFGTGVFLSALKEEGFYNISGYEIDPDLFSKCSGENLKNEDFLHSNELCDGIIMNPPYVRHEKINDLSSYGLTKKSIRTQTIFSELPNTANMYMYFILKAISLLRQGGQLVVIFPCSWMNARGGSAFKQQILLTCGLEKCVNISGDVFEGNALVEVTIFKLLKGDPSIKTQNISLEVCKNEIIPINTKESKLKTIFQDQLTSWAKTHRGITTGYNKMFINPDISDNTSCIPILSSPKDVIGYNTNNARLDQLLYIEKGTDITSEEKEYLSKWKKRIVSNRTPETLYNQILSNKPWYEIHRVSNSKIIFPYIVRENMKFIWNPSGVDIRDNFYGIYPAKGIKPIVLFAILNSYYVYYQLEAIGKKYGAGLLKIQKYDVESLSLPIPNEILIEDIKTLEKLGRKLIRTKDNSVIDEISSVLSNYCKIKSDKVKAMYISTKNERLGLK